MNDLREPVPERSVEETHQGRMDTALHRLRAEVSRLDELVSGMLGDPVESGKDQSVSGLVGFHSVLDCLETSPSRIMEVAEDINSINARLANGMRL